MTSEVYSNWRYSLISESPCKHRTLSGRFHNPFIFASVRLRCGVTGKSERHLNRVLDADLTILEEVLAMSSTVVRDVICRHFEEDDNVDMPVEWLENRRNGWFAEFDMKP